MARNGSEALCRRNPKLDTFLKKKLPCDVFEKVRAYEECIINSEKDKRAFKNVVLSDEYIYITENPPKNIRQEDAVALGDILSIDLVNDHPEFLQGEERENTQHIRVVYSINVSSKTKKKEKTKDKENKKRDGEKDRGGSTTPRPGSAPTNSTPRTWLCTLNESPPPVRAKAGESLLYSLNETELRKLHRECTVSDDDRLSISLPTSELKKLSLSSLDNEDFEYELNSHRNFSRELAEQLLPCRPLPIRPEDNPDDYPSLSTARSYSSSLAATLYSPPLSARSTDSHVYRNLPQPSDTTTNYAPLDRRKAEPFKLSLTDTGELVTPRGEDRSNEMTNSLGKKKKKSDKKKEKGAKKNGSPTQTPNAHLKTTVDLTNGEVVTTDERMTTDELLYGNPDTRSAKLDIYILRLSSPFLMHLRSAWNNHIIRTSLGHEENQLEKSGAKGNKKISREQLELLFNQLKHEIVDPSNTMDKIFEYAQELNVAAGQHFVLKKFFWRNEKLFIFIVTQLQRYLPKSPVNVNSERGRNHRADELDLAILLVDTLSMMFRETEIFPTRLSVLGANKGKVALDLLVVLTCFPEVPQRWRPPITRAATLMFEGNSDGWNTYEDAEVAKLVQELTNVSTAALYELILIAHQANWGDNEGKFFNICWVMKVLESLSTTTEKFVERMVAQAMRLLSPSKREILTPDEAVLLHQQFSVLQTFIEYSTTTAAHIKTNYREEFRYYVQSPYIVKKLPPHYPISRLTIRLINEVLSFVLGKTTKLSYT